MAVKLKFSGKNDSYTIKGLQWEHLEVLAAVLGHVRLGYAPYQEATCDLIGALENYEGDLESFTQHIGIGFSRDKADGTTKQYDDITIDLSEKQVAW